MIILSISEAYNTWCPLVNIKSKDFYSMFFQHWFPGTEIKMESKEWVVWIVHHRLCRKFYGNYSSEMMEVVLFKGLLFLSTHIFNCLCRWKCSHMHMLFSLFDTCKQKTRQNVKGNKQNTKYMKLLSVPPFNAHSNKMLKNETYTRLMLLLLFTL